MTKATPERIALALAACQGITDAELNERGTGGYAAMIVRKRNYASAARLLDAGMSVMKKQLSAATAQAATMATSIKELEASEAPITDTSEAAALLASFNKSAKE